jgi:hypothetical protein
VIAAYNPTVLVSADPPIPPAGTSDREPFRPIDPQAKLFVKPIWVASEAPVCPEWCPAVQH